MTIEHINWGTEKRGKEEFLKFNQLHAHFLATDDRAYREYLAYVGNERLTYLYGRIMHPKNQENKFIRGSFILNKWNKGRKQKLTIEYLEHCIAQLAALILDLYVHRSMSTDQIHRWRFLQKSLRNDNLPDEVDHAIKHIREFNRKSPQGIEQLEDDFELAYNEYYSVSTDREQRGIALLDRMEEKLELLYQTYKAKFAVERTNLLKNAKTVPAKISPEPPASSVDLRQLYELNHAMHKLGEVDFMAAYQDFLSAFEARQDRLDPMERYILCKYTLNALSHAQRNNLSDPWPKLLHWVKQRIAWMPASIREEGINDFLNTVIVGCMCKDEEFVEEYIRNFGGKLSGTNPQPAITYANTELLFLRKHYTSCLKILNNLWRQEQKGKQYHLFYLLRFKRLMTTTCVELLYTNRMSNQEEAIVYAWLDHGLETFRRYMDRKNQEISDEMRIQYLNFISLTKKIVQLIYKRHQTNIHVLAGQVSDDIAACNGTIARQWMTELCERFA